MDIFNESIPQKKSPCQISWQSDMTTEINASAGRLLSVIQQCLPMAIIYLDMHIF